MAENSKIEWTDHTFNPWIGCAKVSEGCRNCYAESMSKRFGGNYWGVGAERKMMSEAYWNKPHTWNRKAGKEGRRYRVFCGSMCDVFEDRLSLNQIREHLFYLIFDTPHLDWLLLTKRPENVIPVLSDSMAITLNGILENVWIGTSVENQEAADQRIPELLKIPAMVRFLSMEPLLGPVDLGLLGTVSKDISPAYQLAGNMIDWVIVGGESGPNARPMHPDWARSIRDQCQETGVPYFFKQMAKKATIPEDLMIREYPVV